MSSSNAVYSGVAMEDNKTGRNLRSTEVLEWLKQYIIGASLREGDRLPTEGELADRFGVSRTSVREAIKSLSFLGILDSKPRRGTVISSLNTNRLAQCLGFQMAITDMPRKEMIEARLVIELGSLLLVKKNMTESQREKMWQLLDQGQVACDSADLDLFIQVDHQFHELLMQMGGNSVLFSFVDLLRMHFRLSSYYPMEISDMQLVHDEHREIFEALLDDNYSLAQGMLHKHIMRPLMDAKRFERS